MSKYEFIAIDELLKQNNLTISEYLLFSCSKCGANVYITKDTHVYPKLLDGTRMIAKETCRYCGREHYLELSFSNDYVEHKIYPLSAYIIHPIDIKELTLFTGVTLDEILNEPYRIRDVYTMYKRNYMLYHSYKQNLGRRRLIRNMQDRKLPLSGTAFAITHSPCYISLGHFLVSLDKLNDKCYDRNIEEFMKSKGLWL